MISPDNATTPSITKTQKIERTVKSDEIETPKDSRKRQTKANPKTSNKMIESKRFLDLNKNKTDKENQIRKLKL